MIKLLNCLLTVVFFVFLAGSTNPALAQPTRPTYGDSVACKNATNCATECTNSGDDRDPKYYCPSGPQGLMKGPIEPKNCNLANGHVSTAIGCIPVRSSNEFIGWFLRWSIGIAGGIAFLMIVFASFQVMTAGGDPQKLQGGRELLTAAISGLILIIFSIFLLRLIGVTILDIPV